MAGVVHIPWYATGFRGDKLEKALGEAAALSTRYGATSYNVWRSQDDRYKFLMTVGFESKLDWQRYWDSEDMIRFRALSSGWYQVPVLYYWHDLVVTGHGAGATNGDVAA